MNAMLWTSTMNDDEPKSVAEAVNGKNGGEWKQALEAKYESLVKCDTWELVQNGFSKLSVLLTET